MDYNINFPHLGIYLDHVGKNFQIGNFTIAYYGITMAVSMVCGLLIALRRAKETKQKTDTYVDLFIFLIIFSIIGARIYYVAFSWDKYRDNLLSIFNLRQGGLAIYGGIIAGILTVIVFGKLHSMNIFTILDTCSFGCVLGQIIGRWGNFFNREAFGEYTDSLFAMQLPVSAVRQNEITDLMWEHVVNLNGVTYIQVHPTFLYESLWNLGVLIVLLIFRNRVKFQGETFFRYLVGYGFGRFLIEGLRTDQLLIPGTDYPVSQYLGLFGSIASALIIVFVRLKIRGSSKTAVKQTSGGPSAVQETEESPDGAEKTDETGASGGTDTEAGKEKQTEK